MNKITIGKTINNIVAEGYAQRMQILTNIIGNIEKHHQENIYGYVLRQQYIEKTISIIKELNDTYQTYTKLEKNTVVISDILCDNMNSFGMHDYIYRQNDIAILCLIKSIGSTSILDTLAVCDKTYIDIVHAAEKEINKNENSNNIFGLLPLLNTIFNPIEIQVDSCKITPYMRMPLAQPLELGSNASKPCFEPLKRSVGDKLQCFEPFAAISVYNDSNSKYEILLGKCYQISVEIESKHVIFVGYFNQLMSNILKEHLGYKVILTKKQQISDHLHLTCKDIMHSYIESFIDSLSIGDMLANSLTLLQTMLSELYTMYTRSLNQKFKVIVNDFLQANLVQKFCILKSLLLSTNDTAIRNGAMLFGITKDQSKDIRNSMLCVADIMYKQLSFSLQLKLHKTEYTLKQALENIKQMTIDDIDLRQQCTMNMNLDNKIKKNVFDRLDEMGINKSEYYKNFLYVKTIIDYPWISKDYVDTFVLIGSDIKKCREKLDNVKTSLDSVIFGHIECKNTLCENVGKWFSNPQCIGKSLGLWGPPGVGKTLIAMNIGKSLGIPYQEIHLGGLEDGAVLSGHSFTYSAAQPGLIVTKMVQAGEPRTVLFFDELDKTCMKHGINEIYNVLIHATDVNTNSQFNDKFFQDVTFPLTKCIFIFSFNDKTKIDPILLDRMEIIEIKPYSTSDKIQIATKHVIPAILNDVGLPSNAVCFSSKQLEYIINNYTAEAGVRTLKTLLEKIALKINLDKIYQRNLFADNSDSTYPIKITKKYIVSCLGPSNNQITRIHNQNQIGVINGLFATNNGYGGIIPIIIYNAKHNSNKFKIHITGKQGSVMQESVKFAWVVAKNCIKNEYMKLFYETNMGGLHVHTPDGATPKDGPSAGIAFAVAFISRITSLPTKNNIAMTGELGIGGSLMAIGGLPYKLCGAKAAGVNMVCVCRANMIDIQKIKKDDPSLFVLLNETAVQSKALKHLNEVPKHIKNAFYVNVVNDLFDIIDYALIDKDYVQEKYGDTQPHVYEKTADHTKFMCKVLC